jgi:hypothetical protein
MSTESHTNHSPLGDGEENPDAAPILALKKLDKRFGATHALKAVDLEFQAGEIQEIDPYQNADRGPCQIQR